MYDTANVTPAIGRMTYASIGRITVRCSTTSGTTSRVSVVLCLGWPGGSGTSFVVSRSTAVSERVREKKNDHAPATFDAVVASARPVLGDALL